jgi:hypothetical protein
MGAETIPVQAMPEFVEFIAASRPGWDKDEIWKALAACLAAEWSWQRVVSVTWRTACIADSTPEDIRRAAVALPSQQGGQHG